MDDSAITPVQLNYRESCTPIAIRKVGKCRLRDSDVSLSARICSRRWRKQQGNVSLAAERSAWPRTTCAIEIARLGLSIPRSHRHRSRILEDPVSTCAEASSLEWERRLLELTHTRSPRRAGRQFWLRHGPTLNVCSKPGCLSGWLLWRRLLRLQREGNWTADPSGWHCHRSSGPWAGRDPFDVARCSIEEINDNGGLIGRPSTDLGEDNGEQSRQAVVAKCTNVG